MTDFLLVRHGTTSANGRMLAGWMNGVRLNDAGRAEVRALAARLAESDVAALYTSPLDRTRETAALLGERLGLEPRLCEEAAEIRFGRWTGRDFADLDADAEFRRWNTFRSAVRAPGGETMVEVQARIVGALQRLAASHRAAAVAVVSHGDVIRAALAYWLGVPLDLLQRIEVAPASVSVVTLDEERAAVLCVNDTGRVPVRRRSAASGAWRQVPR